MFPINYSQNLTPPDMPDVPTCPDCLVEMEEGHTSWSCPECGHMEDMYPEDEPNIYNE